jgi:Na+/H+ antiporter NhaD/arsenite permease-like protein
MLSTLPYILAALAVGAVALLPGSARAAAVALALAAADVPLVGTNAVVEAAKAVTPLVVVLGAGLLLARAAMARGFVDATCRTLLSFSAGSSRRLYLLACALAAILTAAITLDGAIVLMVPIVLRFRPSRPLLLGVVATVNAFSLALPEGNPTNLVVFAHLHLPLADTVERTLPASVLATAVCLAVVAVVERRSLAAPVCLVQASPSGTAVGLGVVAKAAAQVSALLLVLLPIAPDGRVSEGGTALLLAVGLGTAIVAAIVNNLPASAMVATSVTGTAAFSALAGLSIGALATSQGSVATILAGEDGYTRWFAPGAFLAVVLACLVMASI